MQPITMRMRNMIYSYRTNESKSEVEQFHSKLEENDKERTYICIIFKNRIKLKIKLFF